MYFGENFENESTNESIFEVFHEAFLLGIVGQPGFPQESKQDRLGFTPGNANPEGGWQNTTQQN